MKALVLDMDGVIVDSEVQWQVVEGDFFRKHVPAWRDEDHHKIVGLAVVDLYHWLVKEYSMTTHKDVFLKECHELAETVYRQRVTLAPGLVALLDAAKAAGLKIGVATSSPREWVRMVLDRFSLERYLDDWACADDVAVGKTKPEPDIYLLAVRRLGLEPKDCLAIEDSPYGVKAAKRAGLLCAALRNGSNDVLDLSQADFELRGFAGVTLDALAARVSRV